MTRRSHFTAACLVLSALVFPASAEEFEFAALNRNYSNLVQELEPFEVGPAEVLVRSPEHVLRLASHRVVLDPSSQGGLTTRLEVEIQGSGRIEADVAMTGLNTTVRDALVVPLQRIVIDARLSVARSDEGYVVRALELQPTIQVRIESELAGRLFRLCRPMALVLVSLDCRQLERSLTMLDVPLPKDQSFLLEYSELTEAERGALDKFLDASG